uniref:C-type lectin domain-containing protein n=1 Tax=Neogobius melanostomus TaxID=47308 RepID=A0A8C6TPZ0_9GOBI
RKQENATFMLESSSNPLSSFVGHKSLTCKVLHQSHNYYFIDELKTWAEAQRYCRDHYTDLATVSSLEEAARLEGWGNRTGPAWIGLYDDPASWKGEMTNDSNSWRWSATGTTSPGGYQPWAKDCVLLRFDGVWMDSNCSSPLPFVCYTGMFVS